MGAAVSLVCLLPSAASAHLRTAHYSFKKNTDCTSGPINNKDKLRYADPVGVIFKGTLWYQNRAADILSDQAGLTRNVAEESLAPDQRFVAHDGECEDQDHENSDRHLCKCHRWHVRGKYSGGHGTRGWGVGVPNWHVLTPHRDTYIDTYWDRNAKKYRCTGDAGGNHFVHRSFGNGSGFDRGRREVAHRLEDEYTVTPVEWGNDVTMKQCTGQLAASNGWVYYVSIGR